MAPTIAIDASRLSVAVPFGDAFGISAAEAQPLRTGTERYSYELLAAIARSDRWRPYTLYTNGLPAALPPLGPNFTLRSVRRPRLWTHTGLGPALAADRPDLLFVPAHVVPLAGAPPSVVTIHDLGYRAFPEAHSARRRLELDLTTRWSLRAARRVIAVSGATRDDLLRHYGADPARISVVHHGLSRGFQPTVDPATIQRHGLDGPYFLYVGTLQPRKNLERLIEAFAMAARQLEGALVGGAGASAALAWSWPAGVAHAGPTLAIAGRRGWLSDAIERRAVELGVADRVRFLGYVPDADLPALLSAATAFVFPSLYEGFGMPVLEAMACGAPVLTSSTSSLPEVAGDAALLVDPIDTAAIAAALARLATDEPLRADLRARGLARAAQFSWERCAHETLAVLLEALAQSGQAQ